jgi:hypothetical protein
VARDFNSTIDVYVGHFRKKVQRLKQYELHEEDRLLKKNILVSVLDAVSRTTSNYADGNRERFTGIVANFGDWSDHTRVSAPHVKYFLRNLRSPAYEAARAFIDQVIRKNSHGGLVTLAHDPEFEELRKLWPVPAEQKLVNQLSLSSFTHLNLLYQYRNSLVHELREPGRGMEFHEKHQEPFYHGLSTVQTDGSPGEETLELVYPLNFYFALTENVLKNVERYLRKNAIDPYSCYRFGSSWVGELNQ